MRACNRQISGLRFWIGNFGYRISRFFQFLDFGFWTFSLALGCCFTAATRAAEEADGTSGLPPSSLKPPRGEIRPSYWEQHGFWLVLGALVLLALLSAAVWFLLRPRPPLPPPSAAEAARRQLERLRQQPEDGILLSRVSQLLHGYLSGTFGIAGVELTTAELCQAVAQNREISSDLATEITEFLREGDVRKFAPKPPGTPFGAVTKALTIIDHCEGLRAELSAAAGSADSNRNGLRSTAAAEQAAKGS